MPNSGIGTNLYLKLYSSVKIFFSNEYSYSYILLEEPRRRWGYQMETTLNMHVDILRKISLASHIRGISRSEIILNLIKMIMDDTSHPDCLGRMVQYQKRSRPEDWHVFHVKIKDDEYEYLQDLKKLLKMSVSLIVAFAVKKYLNKLLKSNATDNYRYSNYIIAREIIDDIVCWKFMWGFPPNIGKFL